jgi:hypothetical protein
VISVFINIGELEPSQEGFKHGSIRCQVFSKGPTDEEVHILALLMEKMREIAHDIGKESEGNKVNIVEFDPKKDVRPDKPDGDRGTNQDRQSK